MQANKTIQLPSEVWSQMADVTRAEGKTVDQIFEEAAPRLLRRLMLRSFVVENQQLAAERRL